MKHLPEPLRTASLASLAALRAAGLVAAAAAAAGAPHDMPRADRLPLGFVEAFALAEDRGAVLEQLVAGTDERDYYTCLWLQGEGRLREVRAVLRRWKERSGETGAWRRIEARQALLEVSDDPESTYRFLEEELGLDFDHRRVVPGEVPDRPTRLDQGVIDPGELLADVLRDGSGGRLSRLSQPMLEQLVRRALTERQREQLLDRLERPDVPGLVQAILADFEANPRQSFGARAIHGKLTLAQLEELRGARPEVLASGTYVNEMMRRLAPGPEESMDDPADRLAYLERAWAFARGLPPAFNGLKVHLLYRWLERDLEDGRVDADRFMRYLRLPRNGPHVIVRREDRGHVANLGEDFSGRSPFPPVGSDQELVEECLQVLLADARSPQAYYGVLEERYVKRVFAETKLLLGDPGEAERYVDMLGGPAALEALRARVELDFVRGGEHRFGADDPVSLAVDVKNVPGLIVKVFEIDPVAVFDRFGSLSVATLDLDGLVASSELDFDYDQPPLSRHRETFTFESLTEPGTYVVEFIGGGVSSRAVVRKGALHLVGRVTEAGQVFHVLDGEGRVAEDAVMRFGGRDHGPDGGGEIFVPFSTSGGRRTVLLRRGGVAVVSAFDHLEEDYRLEAAVHAPAEALVAGSRATFVVRPRLTVAGERASLELLTGASLVITSTDMDGAQATKVVPLESIDAGAVLTADVQVPERAQDFTVQLSGEVRSVSRGEDVTVQADAVSFPINRLQPMSPRMTLLTRRPRGFVLEVRGRGGEPVADQEVRVALRHHDFEDQVTARLKTDGDGRIDLGPLAGVDTVRVDQPAELTNAWELRPADLHGAPRVLHGREGTDLRVPYTGAFGAPDRRGLSLVELRSGRPYRDAFASLAVENRYVVLRGLAPGDYRLVLKEGGDVHEVRVTRGPARAGHFVGARRALSITPPLPLQISGVARDGDDLVVQLSGAGDHARLHVVGSKYLDPFEAAEQLGLGAAGGERVSVLAHPRSTYESGRTISDEYRYILDRREMDVYPGNMLRRPGFLLNPWAVSETEDRMMQEGRGGGAYRGAGDAAPAPSGRARQRRAGRRAEGDAPGQSRTYDFLARPAVTLPNLTPDVNGQVRIPLGELGPNHMLRLVATDDALTVAWDVILAEQDLERRDLRLADPLDPSRPMTQSRRIAFVPAGESIEIRDAVSADTRTFDTLGDVFELYRTLAGEGSGLAEFEFLTRWPELDAGTKRELYSEFVCHELNAFIKRRDPAFFDAVVAPYVANKGHRTFMDDWLLDADLVGYLEPWRFERLNVVERILLLQRTGGDDGQLARDLMALVPRGAFQLDDTFGTVLASGGLDGDEKGVEAVTAELEERLRSKSERGAAVDRRAPGRPSPDAVALGAPATAGRPVNELQLLDALGEAVVEDFEVAAAEEEMDADAALEPTRGLSVEDAKRRRLAEGFFFRDLDRTREFAETHYWKVRLAATDAGLVTVSPFWVDFAEAEGAFVSGNFPLASRSVNEMLLALAFLDLPFEAAEHEVAVSGRAVRMTAASPLLLALEDIVDAQPGEGAPEVLVGQDFFLPEQRTVVVEGVERERYVTGEFLTGRPYGIRVVLTNPSSASLQLQALLQIPEGAMPLADTRYTTGVPVELGPYGTRSLETFFYFPEPGSFVDYPVHAGQGDVLLGAADPRTLDVVDVPTTVDRATWEWVSQNGELDELLRFMAEGNPRGLDLGRIAWRMGDRTAFDRVTAALDRRGVMAPVLWQYGVKHRDSARTAEFLGTNRTILERVGAAFRSDLLTVIPQERATYEHLAYEPLVVGRVHAFGDRMTILNDQLRAQYGRFIERLALQAGLSDEDRLELVHYLLLQSRIGEALEVFGRVERGAVRTALQYDAMDAYLAFTKEDVDRARAIAERHVDHPVDRWRNRFREVVAQADEIQGRGPTDAVDPDDRDSSQGARAGQEPVLAVQVDGGEVIVDHERIEEVELRFHRMDVEFLFSGSPFVRGDGGAFGLVRPNRTETVALAADATRTEIPLPESFRAANVMVEVRGAGLARRATYFAGDLVVQGLERYGQIRVVDGRSRAALSKAYVKVYARTADGEVRFHKDGYTDLRGRFDYVSLSGVSGPPVERYAVLVMHEDAGARIQELAPPQR